jgi:cell division septal protein FtsQ
MEKEIREEQREKSKKKRIVSIFRKRKKSDIRPFVKETKQRKFKKILFYLFIIIVLIFCLTGFFFSLRFIVIPKFFESKNTVILSPVDKNQIQNEDIKNLISESGLDVSDIVFSDLTVSFMFHRDTKVVFSTEKDIKTQLNLLVSIDQQMTFDNKRAIYIDLRYNKPIVKF